jgi:hypothetical protein
MASKHTPPPPRASLADALFPKVRQRVLAVLFDTPGRSFFMGEVIAMAHSGTGAVQRELADLAASGVLTVHKQGKQKHYQANADAPVFDALSALVGQTMGVNNVIRTSLARVSDQVNAAFVVDQAPTAQQTPVTVMLFGIDAGNGAVSDAMQSAANILARQVSFTLHTTDSVAAALEQDSRFLVRMLQVPKTWIVGSEDALFNQTS